MRKIRKSYRRTHTMSLWGCREEDLLSPMTPATVRRLVKKLVVALEKSGFVITRDKRGRRDIRIRPFGKEYGYTVVIILSESHFAFHTYPEEKYGRVGEAEFNLCYLNSNHMPKLKAFAPVLAELLGATRVTIQHSRRRYFSQV